MNDNCETLSKKHRKSLFTNFKKLFKIKRVYKTIDVVIPIGFMNCGVSICNKFIADTNNSANWDTICFPLPKPKYKWNINGYKADIDKPNKKTVKLIDKP